MKADTQTILSLHNKVVTHNNRVTVTHDEPRTWNLHIRQVKALSEIFSSYFIHVLIYFSYFLWSRKIYIKFIKIELRHKKEYIYYLFNNVGSFSIFLENLIVENFFFISLLIIKGMKIKFYWISSRF